MAKTIKKKTKTTKTTKKKIIKEGVCENCYNVRHRPRNILRCAFLDGKIVSKDNTCKEYKGAK